MYATLQIRPMTMVVGVLMLTACGPDLGSPTAPTAEPSLATIAADESLRYYLEVLAERSPALRAALASFLPRK